MDTLAPFFMTIIAIVYTVIVIVYMATWLSAARLRIRREEPAMIAEARERELWSFTKSCAAYGRIAMLIVLVEQLLIIIAPQHGNYMIMVVTVMVAVYLLG